MLGICANNYFSPSLAEISSILNLPEDVAGLTFLALGNGLPDISSTFVAVSTDAFGLSIGELLGAGVFVTTIIVAGISLSSTTQLDKGPFFKRYFFLSLCNLFNSWDCCG